MRAICLYGILPGQLTLDFGRTGLGGGMRVHSLPGKQVSMLVSSYQGPPLNEIPKPNLLRLLTTYQQILERALVAYPVLPIKFGTMLRSLDEARRVLTTYDGQFMQALEHLGDAQALEVVATWNLPAVLAEIQQDPAVTRFIAEIMSKAQQDPRDGRIEVGQFVHALVEQCRKVHQQRLLKVVGPHIRQMQANPLFSDEWVYNLSFLIDRYQMAHFMGRLEDLDEEYQNQLSFRQVGPLPPYPFFSIEIQRPDPLQVATALQLLELDEQISEHAVQTHYRRLAPAYHPDRHPDDPRAHERFTELAKAHTLLLTHLRCQGEPDPDFVHTLSPGALKKMLSVMIHVPETPEDL